MLSRFYLACRTIDDVIKFGAHVSTDTRNQAEETDRATSQLTRNCNGGCRGLLYEDPQFDFITAGMVVSIGYRP